MPAPPLLHEARTISRGLAEQGLNRFLDGRIAIAEQRPDGLTTTAWRLAGQFGWAKTYDAEYLALATLLGCRLLTLDMRLRRGTERLGVTITPTELVAEAGSG